MRKRTNEGNDLTPGYIDALPNMKNMALRYIWNERNTMFKQETDKEKKVPLECWYDEVADKWEGTSCPDTAEVRDRNLSILNESDDEDEDEKMKYHDGHGNIYEVIHPRMMDKNIDIDSKKDRLLTSTNSTEKPFPIETLKADTIQFMMKLIPKKEDVEEIEVVALDLKAYYDWKGYCIAAQKWDEYKNGEGYNYDWYIPSILGTPKSKKTSGETTGENTARLLEKEILEERERTIGSLRLKVDIAACAWYSGFNKCPLFWWLNIAGGTFFGTNILNSDTFNLGAEAEIKYTQEFPMVDKDNQP